MTLFKKLSVFTVLCLLISCFASAAFASKSYEMLPESIKAKGKIVIGINGIFPPMEYKEPGSDDLIGVDVDLAKALGKELNIEIVFDDQKFDQLINSINTNRVDMVLSGLSDTAARRKTLDFVDYFNSGTQCFTTKKYADKITSLESLSGTTFAVSAATDYLITMKKWSKDNLEAKGKPAIAIMAVDSAATARMQMLQGRAQASAVSPEALGWVNVQQNGAFVPVGPVVNPDPYGICFSKENTQLRDAVYVALKALFDNGTYKQILAKWNVSTGALAQPLINGQPVK